MAGKATEGSRRVGLMRSLTANLDRLTMLLNNLTDAGYPVQASSVQWAIMQLDLARGELQSTREKLIEANKKDD